MNKPIKKEDISRIVKEYNNFYRELINIAVEYWKYFDKSAFEYTSSDDSDKEDFTIRYKGDSFPINVSMQYTEFNKEYLDV